MNPLMQAARAWWEAERRSPVHMVPCTHGTVSRPDDRGFDALSDAEHAWVLERVGRVFDGEVQKSGRGAGDIAIWEGRFRCWDIGKVCNDADAVEYRKWEATRQPSRGPRRTYPQKVQWRHWYDSLPIDETTQQHTRLFASNATIGNMSLTNMQVPGQLAYDSTAHLLWMYVSFSEFEDDWGNILHGCIIDPAVGSHPEGLQHSARSLIIDPHPINITVPVRQNFGTEVMIFGAAAFAELKRRVAIRDKSRPPLRLYVHYEGWDTRYVA